MLSVSVAGKVDGVIEFTNAVGDTSKKNVRVLGIKPLRKEKLWGAGTLKLRTVVSRVNTFVSARLVDMRRTRSEGLIPDSSLSRGAFVGPIQLATETASVFLVRRQGTPIRAFAPVTNLATAWSLGTRSRACRSVLPEDYASSIAREWHFLMLK